MRISSKGRYALASMTFMSRNYASGIPITIIRISEELGISKIYLEQVFSLLKRAGLVRSIKGSQGGYLLTRSPGEITAYDVLSTIELGMMEKTEAASPEKQPLLDKALSARVYEPLDKAIHHALSTVTMDDILAGLEEEKATESLIYFI